MTNFTNPLNPQQNPTNTNFASINFTDNAILLWSSQNITVVGQYYVASQTDLNPTNASTLNLPPISLASKGASFTLTNLSAFAISILADDGSSVVSMTSGQSIKFILANTFVPGIHATAWQFVLIGVTTNTNTLSQNLGNSLKFVASTNKVQVGQLVTAIQVALPLVGLNHVIDSDTAKTYSATVLYNPPETQQQINILLDPSNTLYGACGFYATFINEAAYPVVIQTTGDTINGFPLQSTANTASFVLVPGGSVTLTSSPNGDWAIMNQSTQFQSVFKTATLNWSTANYVYLSTPAAPNFIESSILPSSTGAAAVAIDLSNNLDFIFSPLWILTGSVPTNIATLMATLNQTIVWLILPNNLSYIYFIQARITSTLYKFGLAVKFGTSTAVGLPPVSNAFPAGTTATWAMQYSAQVNPASVSLSTQFVSGLLISNGGGGGGGLLYPDISDVDGLVTILGIPGLYIPNGPTRMTSAFIGTKPVAVVVPSSTPADIVVVGAAGSTKDSGKQFSTDVTMGGVNASNNLVPTQKAVRTFVDNAVAGIFDLKGSWNATTNIPHLATGVGTTGDAYMCTVGGTQTILDAAEFPPSGTFTFSPGDLVFFGSTQWHVLASANFVISVNGQTGVVNLTLPDLIGVTITGPTTGEGLIYNAGTSKWENAFPSIPGITANGTTVVINTGFPFAVMDAAAFHSTALFDGAVTFNTTPPRYTGTYASTPPDSDLATIGYVKTNIVSYPNLSNTAGVSVNVTDAVLFAASGAATIATTLGVGGLATLNSASVTTSLSVTGSATVHGGITSIGAYGSICLELQATTNGTGLQFYNGNGFHSGCPIRGFDGSGSGSGLVFTGAGNTGKVYAEWNNSQLATLADVPVFGYNSYNNIGGLPLRASVSTVNSGGAHGSAIITLCANSPIASGSSFNVPFSALGITTSTTAAASYVTNNIGNVGANFGTLSNNTFSFSVGGATINWMGGMTLVVVW